MVPSAKRRRHWAFSSGGTCQPLAVAGEEMPCGKVRWGYGTPAGGRAEMVAHGDAEGVDELDVGGVGGAERSEQRRERGSRRMAAEGLGGGPTDGRVVIGEQSRHRRRPLAVEPWPPGRSCCCSTNRPPA